MRISGPRKKLAIRPSWVRVLAFNRAREPMPPLGVVSGGAAGWREYIGSAENRGKYCERGGRLLRKKLMHYALELMRRAHGRVVKVDQKKKRCCFSSKRKREKGPQ